MKLDYFVSDWTGHEAPVLERPLSGSRTVFAKKNAASAPKNRVSAKRVSIPAPANVGEQL